MHIIGRNTSSSIIIETSQKWHYGSIWQVKKILRLFKCYSIKYSNILEKSSCVCLIHLNEACCGGQIRNEERIKCVTWWRKFPFSFWSKCYCGILRWPWSYHRSCRTSQASCSCLPIASRCERSPLHVLLEYAP